MVSILRGNRTPDLGLSTASPHPPDKGYFAVSPCGWPVRQCGIDYIISLWTCHDDFYLLFDVFFPLGTQVLMGT